MPTQLDLQHPLDTTPLNSYTNNSRRASLCSDISEEDDEPGQQTPCNDWNDLLSQFNSQPDMIKLIQLCKQEEDKRRQEETSLLLKQDQVLRQLQFITNSRQQQKGEIQLQLPPLSSSQEKEVEKN